MGKCNYPGGEKNLKTYSIERHRRPSQIRYLKNKDW